MNAVDVTARGLAQRALGSSDLLATPLGATLVGSEDGGSVQDAIGFGAVTGLLAANAPARGAGSAWRAGGYRYTEAPDDAIDYHLVTAGGVKLYVDPQVPMLGFPVGAFGAIPLSGGEIGDPLAEAANAAVNDRAIQTAIDAAANGRWDVLLEAGTYCYSTEFTCDQPIGIIGRGWAATIFRPLSSYSGWFAGFSEVNFNLGDTTADPIDDTSALRLRDFSVRAGGRSDTQQQHGVRFIGRCDRMIMDSVYFAYLRGTALHFGHMNGDSSTVAYAREGMISNVEARYCGDDANARPVVVFDNYGTIAQQDGCNLIVTKRLWVVFPYHTGIHIVNNNAGGSQTRRLAFNNTLVHGIASVEPSPVTSAPLVHIEGKVLLSVFRDLWINSHYTGQYGLQVEANPSGAPSLISFDGGNISTGDGHGFNFIDGYGYTVDLQLWGQAGTGVTVGSNVTGPVTIGQKSGQVPTVSIAPGREKYVNSAYSSSISVAPRAERFVLGVTSSSAPVITYFSGNPEGNVTAPAGSICVNPAVANAANDTTVYVKRSGSGNAGWKQMAEVLSIASASRPSTVSVGVMAFDTTLNKPIWCKAAGIGSGGTWVDATGAAV